MEFRFISADFIPPGMRVDTDDYEGGTLDAEPPPVIIPANVVAPAAQSASQLSPLLPPLVDSTNSLKTKLTLPNIASSIGHMIQGVGFKFSIAPTRLQTIEEEDSEEEL